MSVDTRARMRLLPEETLLVPCGKVSITLPVQMLNLVCNMHFPECEVIVVVETLEASPEQPTQRFHPCVLPTSQSDWAIALSINVDADARRISQALTEPEYLEAWISCPISRKGRRS